MKTHFKIGTWRKLALRLEIHASIYDPKQRDHFVETVRLFKFWLNELDGGYVATWARHALIDWFTLWRMEMTGVAKSQYRRDYVSQGNRVNRLNEIADAAGMGAKTRRRFFFKMDQVPSHRLTPAFMATVVKNVAGLDWRASFDFLRSETGTALV